MKQDMKEANSKNFRFKKYFIVNGHKNNNDQLILDLPSYIYGTLLIGENQALLNKYNEQDKNIPLNAELINLHDMLVLINGKKTVMDSFWENIMPSIKLITNDDTKGLLRIKNNQHKDNGEFSI